MNTLVTYECFGAINMWNVPVLSQMCALHKVAEPAVWVAIKTY